MTLLSNTLEGGSDTTVITAGNSGGASGDAFTAVVASTLTFSATQAMAGSLSMRTGNTATQAYARWNPTAGTAYAARAYFWLGGLTAADERFMSFLDAGGTTQYAYIVGNGAGKLRFGCTGSGTTWTAAATYPTSQWLRIEMYCVAGSTTGNGIAQVGIYLGHDTATPVDTFSSSALNIGGGGASFGQVRFGKGSGSLAQFVYVDDLAVNDSATGLIGPSVAPSTGTITWAHTVAQG